MFFLVCHVKSSLIEFCQVGKSAYFGRRNMFFLVCHVKSYLIEFCQVVKVLILVVGTCFSKFDMSNPP
jgi:hypothetical protein